uniref:Esterase n=1 Tax=Arcella intermedia TaxID=1963864 RepID=A0A6B2LF31_9EUKA
MQNYRDLVIYTPPSYYENTFKKDYPVLFMHDGQNLFNDSTSFGGRSWRCQDTVNRLVVTGDMDEIIIVGIDNTVNRTDELTYSYDPSVQAGGNGDAYLDFVENTVLPFVEQTYRVSKSNRGILGSSLGGLISCYAGWTRSTYSVVGCMSSSFWWNDEDFLNTILTKPKQSPSNVLFYLDSGDSGPDNDDMTQTIAVTQKLQSLGFTLNNNLFYFLDKGGQHNEYYWGSRFWVPMSDLYGSSP